MTRKEVEALEKIERLQVGDPSKTSDGLHPTERTLIYAADGKLFIRRVTSIGRTEKEFIEDLFGDQLRAADKETKE